MAYKPLSPSAQAGAEGTVVSYLKRTKAPTNLLIRFNESGLKSNEISSLLREQKDRRITYDRFTGSLKVYSMAPSPLHQAILNFVVRTLHRALRDGIFTHHEADRVSSSNDPVTIKTTSDVPERTKPLAFSKYADANIVFGLPLEPQIPSVVFEVGLSESRDDLRIDASQWLMHTGNLTRLVVVIDVKEDQKDFTSALKSEETKKRRMALLKQYGNDKALNDNDFSGQEDNDDNSAQIPADQEMVYAAIADNIFLDDWIGPVSATIELWEKGENGPRLRDGPISINPPEQIPRNPTIRIGDIVPPGQREAEFDGSRELELDLQLYRDLLEHGRRECARGRAWKFLRPWSQLLGTK